MLIAALVASGIFLPTSTPPAFERLPSGESKDGQRIAQQAGPRRQLIAIIPDRTTGRDWGLRYLREAVGDFNREAPDAVFCVGDLVQGYSRDHDLVKGDRETFLSIVGGLKMPFYPTPGNHDVVSGTRSAKDHSFAEQYRSMFGPLYYAVELDLASMVILNTEDGDGNVEPGFSDTQLEWLDKTLGELEARKKPIILLFHRPLWDHKPTRWDERVQPMLVKHHVAYVIAGHYHALQALPPRDGIPYLLLGTCGGAIDQHPLTGQLQHLTYLVIDETGKIQPYHQIAGCTLPVDWITKEDQDLAYKLKSARDVVTLRGAIEDPLGKPASGAIDIEIKNPLDRAMDVTLARTSAPQPWQVTDHDERGDIERVWTSRTPIDIFNRDTTDLNTPFSISFDPPALHLGPGERKIVKAFVRCQAQPVPPLPAPFDIVATYTDTQQRHVPVTLRQRLPIARTIAPADSLAAATAYPIAVWNWTEYDTPEPNGTARFLRGTAETPLEIVVNVPDIVFSGDAKPSDAKGSLEDPLGDALRLVLGEGPDSREFLLTFANEGSAPVVRTLSPDRNRLNKTEEVAVNLTRVDRSWTVRLQVSAKALPAETPLAGLPINLGVADNDSTYHTQWRWLAPKQVPAHIAAPPQDPASPQQDADPQDADKR